MKIQLEFLSQMEEILSGPGNTDSIRSYLRHGRLMKIQLELLSQMEEISRAEDDRV
jgi:hypothetical protein